MASDFLLDGIVVLGLVFCLIGTLVLLARGFLWTFTRPTSLDNTRGGTHVHAFLSQMTKIGWWGFFVCITAYFVIYHLA